MTSLETKRFWVDAGAEPGIFLILGYDNAATYLFQLILDIIQK